MAVSIDVVRDRFRQHGELVSFKPGQLLCDSSYISGTIFLINKGSARLLLSDGKHLKTIYRLGADDLIGAASLLRGSPSELVRASEGLQAYAITDQQFGDLLKEDDLFRGYFLGTVFPADLLAIACLLYTSPSPRDKRQSRMPSSA